MIIIFIIMKQIKKMTFQPCSFFHWKHKYLSLSLLKQICFLRVISWFWLWFHFKGASETEHWGNWKHNSGGSHHITGCDIGARQITARRRLGIPSPWPLQSKGALACVCACVRVHPCVLEDQWLLLPQWERRSAVTWAVGRGDNLFPPQGVCVSN